MARGRKHDPLQVGHVALIASIASIALTAVWFSLAAGRSGSLAACIDNGETVRAAIGWIAGLAIAATMVLAITSLFTPSRWWGLSAAGIIVLCVPVMFVITAIATYGDAGVDPHLCPI